MGWDGLRLDWMGLDGIGRLPPTIVKMFFLVGLAGIIFW